MYATVEPVVRASKLLSTLVVAIAMVWMAAAGNAHAAKPDAICDGLTGVARGICKAGSALGCGVSTKHQKQCDRLADKYEQATGLPPPWEEPVYPSNLVTLLFDTDAVDLETGNLCIDFPSGGGGCNDPEGEITPPNDLYIEHVDGEENPALFVITQSCGIFGGAPGLLLLPARSFATVTEVDIPLEFEEGLFEAFVGSSDTMIMRTCDGLFFKVGNVQCNDGASAQCTDNRTFVNTVSFAFERLEP